MAENMKMHVITYTGEGCVMKKSAFTFRKKRKTLKLLKGEEALGVAGITGSVVYFAEHRVYGFFVCLPDIPGRPKFCWLFRSMANPSCGFARPLSWYAAQRYTARMSVAEYVVCCMNMMLENRCEEKPNFMELPRDRLLAELMVLFSSSLGAEGMADVASVTPGYDLDLDDDGKHESSSLRSHTVRFTEDGSRMAVDSSGYHVVLDDTYVVPDLSGQLGNIPLFRAVQIQPCDEALAYDQ